ncbi:hypothetical protein Acr_10g0010010 [Actinidia rufa]|uniref:Uncharacterized protein n=1 Tax=Actinidia rufa TaxID=165716 RepID=A0A7J0FB15_9ERIC|nr:hypothetical protein Acr_10g0010010 [Actinidia rufa]
MTQGDLDKLRKKYSSPPKVQLRIPGEGETILSTGPGKRHMSCEEFRCLYSLSSLPDSGWYYFKARPDMNLLRESPSNVKGWKKRFFFASGDEWEFFLSMPPGERSPRVPRSWGLPEKHYNKLPTLTENEAKRMAKISSSGRENTTSGDEGVSRLFRGDLQRGSPSRSDSIEYLGVIKGDIGRITRKAFLDTPNLTLLRYRGLNDVECPCGAKDIERDNPSRRQEEAQNRASQAESQLASMGEQAMKTETELKDKFEAMARESFEFCKRQLLHHHPNLSVDLESMEMDADLIKEEAAAKASEKEEDNEGEVNHTP